MTILSVFEYNYLFVNVILLFDIYDRLTGKAAEKKKMKNKIVILDVKTNKKNEL